MDRGPVTNLDFRAQDMVLIRIPECISNLVETVETMHSKRTILLWDMKVSLRYDYLFIFYFPTVIRNLLRRVRKWKPKWTKREKEYFG